MTEDSRHPAVRRLLADQASRDAFETLRSGISGADLTSLLLAVFSERASERRPADLLRQYATDRFVAPGALDAMTVARTELQVLEAVAEDFEAVTLAPVTPLGTHLVMGAVPQNNVVTTTRLSEVTADPTNSLALEAACRRAELLRSNPKDGEAVFLSAVHRVVRAQHFEGPRSFAHFSLLGLVAAGRDTGNHLFESESTLRVLNSAITAVRYVTAAPIRVRLTPFSDEFTAVCDVVSSRLAAKDLSCELWPEREHGRHYYQNVGFKIYVDLDGDTYEIGDGGDVAWTQALLQNHKERLVIGGLGLDRLVMLRTD